MSDVKELIFSVKFNEKSITSRGWSIKREFTYDLIPQLPYETECDIILDGINAKAKLNIQPRLFYKNDQTEFINHLKKLLEQNKIKDDRVNIKLLLNKSEGNFENSDELYSKYNQLKYANYNIKFELEKLKEKINFLEEDNEKLHRNLLASEKENKILKKKLSNLNIDF